MQRKQKFLQVPSGVVRRLVNFVQKGEDPGPFLSALLRNAPFLEVLKLVPDRVRPHLGDVGEFVITNIPIIILEAKDPAYIHREFMIRDHRDPDLKKVQEAFSAWKPPKPYTTFNLN